jgi:DNA mismatch repair protein MutS
MVAEKSLTPMLKQYLAIKETHKDKILFFRMGDFYEMFFKDAEIAAKILGIALTSRHKESNIPMCGIPYHALSNYTQKLLDHGYKIAICEQVEDPRTAKTIVKRDVVKILTPAVNSEIDNLYTDENYFLFVYYNETLAIVDFASGEFFYETNVDSQSLINEIEKHQPKELLLTRHDFDRLKKSIPLQFYKLAINFTDEKYFLDNIETDTWISNIDKSKPLQIVKIVLNYILENNGFIPQHLKHPEKIYISKYLVLDDNALSHLEILKNASGKKDGSLYSALNSCITPMGGRLLKKWLSYPLLDTDKLKERYDFIEELTESHNIRKEIKVLLSELGDLERLNGKIALKNILPQELVKLKDYLETIPLMKQNLSKTENTLSKVICRELNDLKEVIELIKKYILPEPSNNLANGDYINQGISKELDELKELRLNARKWLLQYETSLKEDYGISNLKIKFNKIFGYFIEVSKRNSEKIPDRFIRKQTLVNAERYVTEELKEFEEKIISADENIEKLQKQFYFGLLEELTEFCIDIKNVSELYATVDILTGFARKAIERTYVKPVINNENVFHVINGRHPVLEEIMDNEFIPNSLSMDSSANVFIITGPNMAGKSTYMRQNALLAIMAQVGSFVPAESFNYPVFDRIFTRIGAKDKLLEGESTFMVEMKETSKILGNLTEKSFIILDEIGRGTSTYDGMSIAWAVLEFLASNKKKFFVLFATHYHELTALENDFPNIVNYSVNVKETEDKLLFLRQIKKGPSDRSYGIEVASLAKIPQPVINRAKEILHKLESRGVPDIRNNVKEKSIFEVVKESQTDEIIKELAALSIDETTPIEALNFLYKIKEKIKKLP